MCKEYEVDSRQKTGRGKTIVKTMRCLLRASGIGFLNGPCRLFTCPVSKNSIHGKEERETKSTGPDDFSGNGSQKGRLFPVAGGCGFPPRENARMATPLAPSALRHVTFPCSARIE